MAVRAVMSWSTGKDSALALHEVRSKRDIEVVALLTTVTSTFGRVSMHGVREELLDAQANALRLPCYKVSIPSPCPNEVYERAMGEVLGKTREQGVTHVVFGDLFLEDLRAYRESKLAAVGMKAVFPLWGRETASLARTMIEVGIRATVTCIDPKRLDRSFAGRPLDADFLRDLPAGVDPCGENGEFHTFAHGGPMFARRIPVQTGEVVERDGFVFADVLPLPFPESLCHTCAAPPKYVRTATSTFVLCPLLPKKYPPQPVRTCPLYRRRELPDAQ
jgi:uncharacterized protein (TIGR00290 family)